MTDRAVAIRPATQADLGAIRAIVDAEEPPPPAGTGGHPEAVDAYYVHLIRRGLVLLAEDDQGAALGFGAVIDSGRSVHLADLFVRREAQSGGIGRRLLERLFRDRWPRTTFSSDDPRALPLYVRMGMRPLWPNLYVLGDAAELPDPVGFAVEQVAAGAVADLEREWTGVHRPIEHGWLAGQPDAAPLVVRDAAGRAVAAGHARARLTAKGRWMNTLLVAPGADGHDPTLAAVRWSAIPALPIGMCVPGPHPIVPTLVRAGFRVVDRDTFQASDPALIDPERVLINTGIL